MDMTEGKCVWLGILQLLPLPGRGKYAGCYLYGIRSGDTDASYGSPLGGGYGTNGIFTKKRDGDSTYGLLS